MGKHMGLKHFVWLAQLPIVHSVEIVRCGRILLKRIRALDTTLKRE